MNTRRFTAGCVALACFCGFCAIILDGPSNAHARGVFVQVLVVAFFVWISLMILSGPITLAARVARAVLPWLFTRRLASKGYPARDAIEQLCQRAGWVLASRSADQYVVRSADHRSPVAIEIRYSEQRPNVVFQAFLGIRFSLENPPSGLFGRLLLRNTSLAMSAWAMSIGQSCEACPFITASLPRSALDAMLFDLVCREIAGEHLAFRQELHDRFGYSMGQPVSVMDAGWPEAASYPGQGTIRVRRGGPRALPDDSSRN